VQAESSGEDRASASGEFWRRCPLEASHTLILNYVNKVQKHEKFLPKDSYTAAHFPNQLKMHMHFKIMDRFSEYESQLLSLKGDN